MNGYRSPGPRVRYRSQNPLEVTVQSVAIRPASTMGAESTGVEVVMAILDLARPATRTVRTFCSLCKVICPAVVTVEAIRADQPGAGPRALAGRRRLRQGPRRARDPRPPEPSQLPAAPDPPEDATPTPAGSASSWDEALDLIAAKLPRGPRDLRSRGRRLLAGDRQRHRRPRHRSVVRRDWPTTSARPT